MTPPLVILILSLLLGMQPLTSDLYLPALPALTDSLGTTLPRAQLSLTAMLLAFGASQLVWGPLSDRFGRRPVLLAGLAGYVAAALGSALAGSIEALVVWRALQGACMGAGTVCARAIVRDYFSPTEGARAMSKGLTGLGFSACLGPLAGGLIAETLGWRATLFMLVVLGAIILFVVARYFEETLPLRDADALRPRVLARTAGGILGSGDFWAFALLSACSFGGLFCFLSASSYVFIRILGIAPRYYGVVLLVMMIFYIKGTVLCRYLILRGGVAYALRMGGAFSLCGGTLMAGLALAGVSNVWAILVPACIFNVGHGINQPCGQSGAIAPFPRVAGAASALSGCLMMLFAFASGSLVGALMDGTALPMVLGVGGWSVAVAAVAWGWIPRRVRA